MGAFSVDLKDHIRSVPDFPKPGILFYDISTLLRHADAWGVAMGRMANAVRAHQPDLLAGIESRGFLIAAPLALKLGCGFVMLRKKGKLPGLTIGLEYGLEYGADHIEIQADAVKPGQRVVVVDDLLATGGTMAAGIKLLREVGAVVPAAARIHHTGKALSPLWQSELDRKSSPTTGRAWETVTRCRHHSRWRTRLSTFCPGSSSSVQRMTLFSFRTRLRARSQPTWRCSTPIGYRARFSLIRMSPTFSRMRRFITWIRSCGQ
jgi:adenine phosphoribosyltransferase